METYKDLKERQSQEFNALPIFWAFSKEQFKEGLKEFGLKEEEKEQLCGIFQGGYCKKVDSQVILDTLTRHDEEHLAAISADTTGQGYIEEMFECELANHEYCYTHDVEPTLDALSVTRDDLEKSEALRSGLKQAILNVREAYIDV